MPAPETVEENRGGRLAAQGTPQHGAQVPQAWLCLLLRRGCHNSPMLPSTLLPPNVCHGDLARNGERFGLAVYIVCGRARCRYCCNFRLSTSPPTPSVALCMSLITRGDSTRNVIEEEDVQSTIMSVCLQQASSRQHKQPRSNGTLPTGEA